MIDFNEKQYLVFATSTDIGKTFFVSNICKKLKENNVDIHAIKPVISGFDFDDKTSDTAKIIDALGMDFCEDSVEKISPFRLKAPFSPLKAGKMEGKTLDFDKIVDFCKENIEKSKESGQNLLIEGAGGVMSPINDRRTFLDLASELKLPIILISGVFLGSIGQTLCAIEALKSRNIKVEVVIVNEFGNDNSDLTARDIMDEIEIFSKIKCFSMLKIAD